ncbi:MAG: Na/Pi cotransporter family protein [bacterium]|nr:Na/Pi cotransporter family protein [bacterium]
MMGLFGGLALFLYGMEKMADALKLAAGDQMKNILAKLTTNRVMGLFTGAFVTAVIQSSSVTTVLVVGFISAGLMSLSQSIGVILGADIGTTITAQIIAFKVTKYALLLVASGFAVMFFSKSQNWKQHGAGVMGLGLIFFGMGVMGDAMDPLRSYPPFLALMSQMESPLYGVLAAALFTAVIQSSSATTGVVIVMASQGLITLPAGIALIFGANIGTCITAILAAVGRPREALRAAVVHVVFKVVGVLLWIAFIDPLADLVAWFSPRADSGITGLAKSAAETPRQIANAHTVFNVANALLFLPFSTQFARLIEWLVPDRPIEEEEEVRAKYLDLDLLDTPSLALDRARLEILHMGDLVREMLRSILPAVLNGPRETVEEVGEMDNSVDALHGQIITYLGQISQVQLNASQTEELLQLMEAVNALENIGDIIETNLVALGIGRLTTDVRVSEATREVINEFHASVTKAFEASLLAITQKNEEAARVVVDMKREINRLADSAAMHEAKRLVATEPNRLPAYTLEIDILENLKRIYYFCKRMARVVVPTEPPPETD